MQTKEYQIIGKSETRKLTQFLCKEGQLLLPMLELISQAEMAVDEVIDGDRAGATDNTPSETRKE